MVSVVIPVYNKKYYVEKMIRSVLEQTFSDLELLLVDDGSTDGVLELMYHYQQIDHRIKVLKRDREPKGAQTCRNIGLESSNGTYVVFFDSDDLISKKCLQSRVEFMEFHNDIDFGIFPAKTFSNDQFVDTLFANDLTWGINTKKDVLLQFLSTKYPFIVVTNIYKRNSLIKNSLYWDEKLLIYQDFDYNISAILKGLKYRFTESNSVGFDYFYRILQSVDNTCRRPISKTKFESTVYLFNKTIQSIKLNKVPQKYYNALFIFVKLYFKNIVLVKGDNFYDEYFSFCRLYYSKFKVIKMKIIAYCTMPIKNPFLSRLIFVSLLCLFFPKSELVERIYSNFKKVNYHHQRWWL